MSERHSDRIVNDVHGVVPVTVAEANARTKSKAKAGSVKTEYNLARSTGPDPRDPRTPGALCHGQRQVMPPGLLDAALPAGQCPWPLGGLPSVLLEVPAR